MWALVNQLECDDGARGAEGLPLTSARHLAKPCEGRRPMDERVQVNPRKRLSALEL